MAAGALVDPARNRQSVLVFLRRVLRSRFKVALTNATNRGDNFGTEFVVKYWYAKHENRECCPQHGALNATFVSLAFSAVTK